MTLRAPFPYFGGNPVVPIDLLISGASGTMPAPNAHKCAHDKPDNRMKGAKKPSPAKRKLSPQEEAFARAIAADPLAPPTAAARAAGYAENGISVAANRLLKRPHIVARIAKLTASSVNRVNAATEAAKAAKATGAIANPTNDPAKGGLAGPPPPEPLPSDLVITLDRVVREVALIGFANMADYIRPDGNGLAVVDLAALTRDQAAAIKEIKVEEFLVGRGEDARTATRTTLKIADKLPALLALGKHLGGFRERVDVDAPADGPLAELVSLLRGIKRSALPVAPADWSEAEVVRR